MLVLSLVVSLIFHRFSWAFEFTQEGLREADDILNLQGFSQYYSDAPNHIFHGQENILQPGQYQSSFQYNTGAQDQPAITSYKQPVLPSTACHEAQISNQILHSQWLQHLAELRFHDGNHLVFDSYPEHSADHQFHQYLDVYADQPESIQLQSNWYPNQNHQNFKEHILEGNFEYLKTPFVWSEAPLDFFNEPHLPDSSLKAAGSTRRVNSEQEEDFINDVVRESDFSLLSQSAMILENGGFSNHFLPKTNTQRSVESKKLPLSRSQEPEIHNLRNLVNHENLNAGRVGSRNFHGYLLSDPHCGSNNNKNSLISNLLPPQSDETNLFDSNYLLRCPHNTIYKSRNEDIESFNIKGDELAEQRVIPENLNNIKFTLETEATLKTPKLSNNLRLHLNVDSPGSLIGQNEDNVPKTIISNTSLDSNIPPLLTNVGHEEIKNLNGKEAAECSKSQTSGDIAILTKQNGTRNKLKDLGKENPKKRKRNPNNLTAEKKILSQKNCFNSNISEEGARKTNERPIPRIVDEEFSKDEALRELSFWENNVFKTGREIEKSKKKMVIVEKHISTKKVDEISIFTNLCSENNFFLDINILKKIIEKIEYIQDPFLKFIFLIFFRAIRQKVENMGTGEFYIPIKDIYEFFQKRVYINSKYENLMDLRTNKYDDKIIAKLPKQILQKIEADLKESTICKQGNIGRYLNYFLRKKLASIEIRNSFISISNIINKVFGNSREEIINNFKKNQKTAIDFFDNILSRVDFRTQNMKDLQVKKGKKTINQFELSFKMQNHLEFNKNSAKNFKPELENTIAMEEAKTVEKVSMFFANNNFADSFTKAITSKILIQWLKIHRPQILINLNPTDEKDRESHTLLLFCRRFLNIMAALDVLEKD